MIDRAIKFRLVKRTVPQLGNGLTLYQKLGMYAQGSLALSRPIDYRYHIDEENFFLPCEALMGVK